MACACVCRGLVSHTRHLSLGHRNLPGLPLSRLLPSHAAPDCRADLLQLPAQVSHAGVEPKDPVPVVAHYPLMHGPMHKENTK